MSAWSDDVLANRSGRDRRPRLKAGVLGAPALAASQPMWQDGDIAQVALMAPRSDAGDGQHADAVAGIGRALQARGLVLAGTVHAPVHLTDRYRDPRAYQAYVEEMACLP